uniref:Uncharacterized protein n=1 Tax=Timema bartmani TaxID=61472 RepID=A0A7R9F806_9NEOP|nr:unnamed protein product [Timema bartmani]
MVAEWRNKELPLEESRNKQKELEKQVTLKHRTMSNIGTASREVMSRSGPPENTNVQKRVDELRRRWQVVLAELSTRRDKISKMDAANKLRDGASFLDTTQACLDQVKVLLSSAANPSDDTSLAVRLSMVKAREEELAGKKRDLEAMSKSKQLVITEKTRRLAVEMDKAAVGLSSHRGYVEGKLTSLNKYINNLDTVIAWTMETKTRINISRELSDKDRSRVIDNIMVSVLDHETEVKEVLENFTNLEKECESTRQPVSVELQDLCEASETQNWSQRSNFLCLNSSNGNGSLHALSWAGRVREKTPEKIKKLREDWHYVKNRGEPISQQVSSLPANKGTMVTTSPLVQKAPSRSPANAKPRVSTGRVASRIISLCSVFIWIFPVSDTTSIISLQGGLRLEISHGAVFVWITPVSDTTSIISLQGGLRLKISHGAQCLSGYPL